MLLELVQITIDLLDFQYVEKISINYTANKHKKKTDRKSAFYFLAINTISFFFAFSGFNLRMSYNNNKNNNSIS